MENTLTFIVFHSIDALANEPKELQKIGNYLFETITYNDYLSRKGSIEELTKLKNEIDKSIKYHKEKESKL